MKMKDEVCEVIHLEGGRYHNCNAFPMHITWLIVMEDLDTRQEDMNQFWGKVILK